MNCRVMCSIYWFLPKTIRVVKEKTEIAGLLIPCYR
jgi:hypothetical protein